jgi:hypothetical protein
MRLVFRWLWNPLRLSFDNGPLITDNTDTSKIQDQSLKTQDLVYSGLIKLKKLSIVLSFFTVSL